MTFFLAIEGADGAGKATATAAVVDRLRADGRRAEAIAFPRYEATIAGRALGDMLAGRSAIDASPRAVAVLYALDRFESADHIARVAAANDVVVFDRYIASNIAYQSAKATIADADAVRQWILTLETEHFGLRFADLNIYLDTPLDRARRQILEKRPRAYTDLALDRNEADVDLQKAVRRAYETMARDQFGGRWRSVSTMEADQMRTPDAIAAEIVAAIS